MCNYLSIKSNRIAITLSIVISYLEYLQLSIYKIVVQLSQSMHLLQKGDFHVIAGNFEITF